MTAQARARARNEVADLVHRDLAVLDYARAAARAVGRGVPFDGVCLVVVDPASGLPVREFVENGLPDRSLPRLAQIEVEGEDVNTFAELASRPTPAASLSAATDGLLEVSGRHRELREPAGLGDELRAALVGDGGAWGALTLMRRSGSAHFGAADVAFVASVSRVLADGLRRALLTPPPGTGSDVFEPGLLVLADDDTVEMANPAARRWLAELRDGAGLPVVVRAVAHRARTAGSDDDGRAARARVRARNGRWLVVHGSVLDGGNRARAAVVLEPARAPDLHALVSETYRLTDRERRVVGLVARGLPTTAIAERMHLSAWTVQDHLKAIFEKTGVGSRGELVALLYVGH